MSAGVTSQHVVVFAQRFSVAKPSCTPCVVAAADHRSSSNLASPSHKSPPTINNVSAEIVNINRHFSTSDLEKRKEDFRRKYDSHKSIEIEVDVSKLSGSYSSAGEAGSSSAGPGTAHPPGTQRCSMFSRKMSQTISFDESGKVIKEEFVDTGTLSEESSVFDENEDPLGDFDFTSSYTSEFKGEAVDKSCQTTFTDEVFSVLTQTMFVEKSDFCSQVDLTSQNDLNKLPNIVVTPPLEKSINIEAKKDHLFSKQVSDPTGKSTVSKSRFKKMINNLQSKSGGNEPSDNQNTNAKPIENLHSSYFSDFVQRVGKKTSNLKDMFETGNNNNNNSAEAKISKNEKIKHEVRKGSVKSQAGAISSKVAEENLLETLLAEVAKLPSNKQVEFLKSFVKTLTDRELLSIVRHRFKDKRDEELIIILKDLSKSVLVDDMYDILEDYINERPYNECKKMTMKICENFLNKKDMTEFVMRNYATLSENDKKVLATSLLEDLSYDSLKKVLELQIPKLKEKDIPNILNNIQTLPNRRELEKAVCILSSRLSVEETQKVIRELVRGMKTEEIIKIIKQLLDYLPKKDSENIAMKYIQTNKVYVEKWTETKSVEFKKMVSKTTGTEPMRELIQTTEKKKVVHVQGESWIGNKKKYVNRACQTDAVNRLLFKDKANLQNSQEVINRAKERFQKRISDVSNRTVVSREEAAISPCSSPVPTAKAQESDSSASSTSSITVSNRKNILEEIERLKQEKQNIYSDYQEYFNIALDQEEEVQSLEEELERSKRLLSDNSEELHYLKEERDNAYKDIKDLEDELADAKILIYNLKTRSHSVLTTGRDGKKVNVANADRLSKELEKFQGLDEELTLLQEDFLEMEQKWLAEQKRKKYYEEMALSEERKAREVSQQLYMMMTNELTPANFKERVMFEDPAALENLPRLSGSQLNALLTLFVAAGALPESKVPSSSEIFTLEELQKSGQYSPDQVGNLLTSGNVNFYANDASLSHDVGSNNSTPTTPGGSVAVPGTTGPSQQLVTLAPGLVYTDKPGLVNAAGLGMTPVQMPTNVPEGMSLVSNELLAKVKSKSNNAQPESQRVNIAVSSPPNSTTLPTTSETPVTQNPPCGPSKTTSASNTKQFSGGLTSNLSQLSTSPLSVPHPSPPAPNAPIAPPLLAPQVPHVHLAPPGIAPPAPPMMAPPAPPMMAPPAPPMMAPPAPPMMAPPAPHLPNTATNVSPWLTNAEHRQESLVATNPLNIPPISAAQAAQTLPNSPPIHTAPPAPTLPNAPSIHAAPQAPTLPNAPPIHAAPPAPTLPNAPSIHAAPPAPTLPNAPPIHAAPTAPTLPNAPPIHAAPPAPRLINAPPMMGAPPAPRPINAPPIMAAPPAPRPINAPPIMGAPPAPRPANAPPIMGAPPAPRPANAPPIAAPPALQPDSSTSSTLAPPVVDSRLMAGSAAPGDVTSPGSFVPRGRLEDLKNRKGRKVRNNTVVKKKTLAFGPTKPLKVFNWAKLPEAKAANSIWKDINEVDMVTMLNLDEIDELFQSRRSTKKEGLSDGKKKTVQIIDAKRAQNLTILLSKFKKTNEQLMDIIMKCDKDNEITIDMWEQLLKYIPAKEEVQALNEVDEEQEASLNRADRYFLHIVGIYHYEERIKSVNYRKKFEERLRNLNPKIRALIKASTEVVKSDKLKDMLTLILGFGNYFNFGKRGNAMGFKLETLTKIGDTRSSDNQLTLLIYLAETVDLIFPELDSFMDDLPNVSKAAKVALAELKADVSEIQSGYRLLIKECDHMAKNPNLKGGSTFKEVFEGFLEEIKDTVVELEQSMGDMKKKYTIATSHFAEASSVEPETFFGYFNTFIMQYSDAKEALYKKREEEEKRKKKLLSVSAVSSPTPKSRPISPGFFSTPNSPIPEDLILDLMPSLEALELHDHDLMMNDLFTNPGESGEVAPVRGPGSTSRRRKRRSQQTPTSDSSKIIALRER